MGNFGNFLETFESFGFFVTLETLETLEALATPRICLTSGSFWKLLRNFWKLFETLETLATTKIFLPCFWGAGNQAREARGTRPGRVPRGTGGSGNAAPVTNALETVRTPLGKA